MFSALRRLFGKTQVRSFDGAAAGRRGRSFGDQPHAISAALAASGPLARRARYLTANNPHAASTVEAWVSALVGTGIKGQSKHPLQTTREALNLAFESWTDEADADGLTDLYGLQAGVARSLVVNGESFVLTTPEGRLRLIDTEQVDRSITRDLGHGRRILQGVEFDPQGRRVAYHLLRDAPGIPFAGSYETIRVSAEDLLHIFRPVVAGQVRGLSWFAPVLLRLSDYDKSIDAQLQRQLVAALLTGFVVDPNGTAGGFDGEEKGGILDASLEPGTLQVLDPGQDIRFSDPAKVGAEVIDFLRITRQEIASGLGVPVHVMTGDVGDANYSSLRAALLEWRRRIEMLQYSVLVHQFCKPVWRSWIIRRALAGAADMPGFFQSPENYYACNFVTPKFDWIDPAKDVQAEADAIAAGLISRREAVAARGRDIEELDREIAADNARASTLGLSFVAPTPNPQEQA